MRLCGLALSTMRHKCVSGNEATFDALQHHPPQFDTSKDAIEWSKCCTIFRRLCEACSWCPWRAEGATAALLIWNCILSRLASTATVSGYFDQGAAMDVRGSRKDAT